MLFLANVTLVHDYLTGRLTENLIRLVEADDAAQARGKVEAAFRRDDPKGHNISIIDVQLHETIT